MKEFVQSIHHIAGKASKYTNYASATMLGAMTALTGIDVITRYIFNSPIEGSFEITEYMMPIIISLALAYCAFDNEHVRIDLLVSRLSERNQTIMTIVADSVFLGVFILIAWQSICQALEMLQRGLKTYTLYLPVAPFILVLTIGSLVLCFVLISQIASNSLKVAKK